MEARKLLGYFVWKITILRQKNNIFSNLTLRCECFQAVLVKGRAFNILFTYGAVIAFSSLFKFFFILVLVIDGMRNYDVMS
jgi:hypothetical protein